MHACMHTHLNLCMCVCEHTSRPSDSRGVCAASASSAFLLWGSSSRREATEPARVDLDLARPREDHLLRVKARIRVRVRVRVGTTWSGARCAMCARTGVSGTDQGRRECERPPVPAHP